MQQDVNKTNAELLDELRELRQRNIALETLLANANVDAEHLREVSETSLDAVIISDQDGNILFWNKRATEIFGYEKEEVLGNPITMLISDEAMGEYTEGKEHVLERGFSLFGKRPKESIAKRKDGTTFPAEFTVSHWKIQDRYYFGGSLRDISEQKRVEEEYERILNMSQDLICIAGLDGYFKYVNPAWERMLGYPREEFLARPFLDFIHPEDHHKNDEEIAKLASGKMTLDFENRYIHKDGSMRTFSWTATPIPEKGLIYCIGRDVTERKQSEILLRESEQRFKDVFDFANDGILIADSQTRKFQGANNAICWMLGYSLEELKNLGTENIHRAEDLPSVFEQFDSMVKGDSAYAMEVPTQRKDGSVFYADLSAYPMKLDGKQCLVGFFRDVTERKQHEAALRESETRFRAIAESSPDAIITTDSTGKILYWNKAAETIYGYKTEEIVGKSIELLRPEGKRLVDRKNRERFIKTGHSSYIGKTVEGMARRKDGTNFPTETSTSYWKAGDQMFFSGIVRDITERKQMENALQREKHFSDTVINSLPGVFYLIDARGYHVRWNKNLEDVTGYSAERLQQDSAISLIHKADRALVENKIKDVFNDGYAEAEARLLDKYGAAHHYYFTGSRVDVGEQSYLTGLGTDITERKYMEHELKKAHEKLEKKVQHRTAELRKANEKLQISQAYLKKFAGMLLSAREDERKNISTALHDELGSMALSVTSKITIAREECNKNDKQATAAALEQAQAAIRRAVEDLRRLAVDLRPPNLEIMGLAAALTEFIDKTKKHAKFKIIFRNELGSKKISEETAIVIYRIIQEAVTNITKHAKAKTVRVRLYADRRNIHLDIADDGAGCDLKKALYRKGKPKIGIEGMRERAESLGGEFGITSAPNRGTQLKATLPKK